MPSYVVKNIKFSSFNKFLLRFSNSNNVFFKNWNEKKKWLKICLLKQRHHEHIVNTAN